jgi:hypothetical protein
MAYDGWALSYEIQSSTTARVILKKDGTFVCDTSFELSGANEAEKAANLRTSANAWAKGIADLQAEADSLDTGLS